MIFQMRDPKICDCYGKMNFDVDDIVFKAEICPDCNLANSSVSLILDTLSFKSTGANLPDYFSADKGSGLSVSGTGILTLSDSRSDVNGFYSLFLFDSAVAKQNLASITFFNINEVGAILAYAITFIAKEVNLTITPLNVKQSSIPSETISLPEMKDIGRDRIIIMKNDQIEVRELE